MNKIGVFIGTRPEFIKCLPLLNSSDIYTPIIVKQHTDILDISCKDSHTISVVENTTNRLNNIIISILSSNVLEMPWSAVLVQGDTAVAYAGAILAFNKKIKIIHLEAGLRTYDNDNPWPEEGYRRMIDSVANVALCPSIVSAENLIREKFTGVIEVVGNTSIDAISSYNLSPYIGNTVIITLHRRENWHQIKSFFETIEEIATAHSQLSFVIPIHPNPEIKKLSNIFTHVKIVDPMPHFEMCKLLSECNCVISDSGGIQEEASFLGKRVFCCRKITERIELLDTYLTYTPTPAVLKALFSPQNKLLERSTIYGDGKAHLKINSVLNTIKCLI